MSASRRFCRLRHLPSWPSQSLTATSCRPASLRLATTFDPMNPAPPVTNSIVQLAPVRTHPLPQSVRGRNQAAFSRVSDSACLDKHPMIGCAEPNQRKSGAPRQFRQRMNTSSLLHNRAEARAPAPPLDRRPILVVPYMWIGDFVRCHSVVKLLKTRYPGRPVDVLSTTLCAPLADYMPELRQAIVVDLPRKRLAYREHAALAERLKAEHYGTVLVMPRTWKAALAPFLAGIPERIGWVGEWRFGLLNDLRRGERQRPRMIDQC